MGTPVRYTLADWIERLSIEHAVKLLLQYFTGGVAPAPPGGGGGAGGNALAVQSSAATAGGSVGAGAVAVSFVTSSDFAGTINGAAFPASAAKSFNAPTGYLLPAIAYTRSAGTLYIDALR